MAEDCLIRRVSGLGLWDEGEEFFHPRGAQIRAAAPWPWKDPAEMVQASD